jgi:hypothetical protein
VTGSHSQGRGFLVWEQIGAMQLSQSAASHCPVSCRVHRKLQFLKARSRYPAGLFLWEHLQSDPVSGLSHIPRVTVLRGRTLGWLAEAPVGLHPGRGFFFSAENG